MSFQLGPRGKEALGDPTGIEYYYGVESVHTDWSSHITNDFLRSQNEFVRFLMTVEGGEQMFETEGKDLDPAGGEEPTPEPEPEPSGNGDDNGADAE